MFHNRAPGSAWGFRGSSGWLKQLHLSHCNIPKTVPSQMASQLQPLPFQLAKAAGVHGSVIGQAVDQLTGGPHKFNEALAANIQSTETTSKVCQGPRHPAGAW